MLQMRKTAGLYGYVWGFISGYDTRDRRPERGKERVCANCLHKRQNKAWTGAKMEKQKEVMNDNITRWNKGFTACSRGLQKIVAVDNKTAYADMPQKLIEYLKSLPEFDAEIFNEITGLEDKYESID